MVQPREAARQARHQLYREHILTAAEKVFAERGYESAPVQEISRLAGLSLGTIYSVFASKEELFLALQGERGEEILARVREVVARELPARETLAQLIRAYVDYFVLHPDFLRLQLGLGGSWVREPRGDQAHLWQEIHAIQADIFRRGIAEGVFQPEDPAFMAKLFSGLDELVLADWVASGMRADAPELAARVQTLADRLFSATPLAP